MSKSSREGIFGITLTELVIILFFIMLLLALFNIERVNEELEETQKLVPESSEDIIPMSTVITLLFPDGEIDSDLVPVKVIEDEIRELQKAQNDFKKLIEESSEGDGDGNCREGYWITQKCADHCWEINSDEYSRQYDYLIDIGVCKSSVVVQRSKWLQKSELDFLLVDGALALTEQKFMKASQLYDYLDIIKEPGYVQLPKQCFHSVNVIDLDGVSAARFDPIEVAIGDRVNRRPLTNPNSRSYSEIKKRFPQDICDIYLEDEKDTNKNISQNQPDSSVESEASTVNIVEAKLDLNSFVDAFTDECSNSRPTRNKSIVLNYQVSLSNTGKVVDVESLSKDKLINSNLKRLDTMARRALRKSKFTPEYSKGVPVPSNSLQKVPFGENACN